MRKIRSWAAEHLGPRTIGILSDTVDTPGRKLAFYRFYSHGAAPNFIPALFRKDETPPEAMVLCSWGSLVLPAPEREQAWLTESEKGAQRNAGT